MQIVSFIDHCCIRIYLEPLNAKPSVSLNLNVRSYPWNGILWDNPANGVRFSSTKTLFGTLHGIDEFYLTLVSSIWLSIQGNVANAVILQRLRHAFSWKFNALGKDCNSSPANFMLHMRLLLLRILYWTNNPKSCKRIRDWLVYIAWLLNI